MASLKTVDLSIGSILQNAWEIFQEHFTVILAITLVIYIPINIGIEFIPYPSSGTEAFDIEGFADYSRMLQIIESFIGIIAVMGITLVTEKALMKNTKEIEVMPVLHEALSRYPAAIATNFLLGLAMVLLFLALIVPGIIYSVYWQFAIIAVVLRKKFAREAMSYSKDLVKGRWWQVFGITLLLGLLSVTFAALAVGAGIYLPDEILTNVIYSTFIDIIVSFFTVAYAVFFLSLEQHPLKK